ncbi:hypothetical protein [Sphingomonas lacusdianchii]|uniref:hypothetical protein n=1 Tax=Sphingomonas lacusdianchii TaxID=2917992 RepID=UPI001F56C426|nr:hypothetical protein [Sphingomonas sp. JXJ CY 53]
MVQTSDPPGQKAAAVAEVDVRKGIAVAIFAGHGVDHLRNAVGLCAEGMEGRRATICSGVALLILATIGIGSGNMIA